MDTVDEHIVILDFGSQYTQLIARRVRECHIYSSIVPFSTTAADLRESKPTGIILSGGPASVYGDKAPQCDPELFELGVPILGICYGLQLTVHLLDGEVVPSAEREFGYAQLEVLEDCPLFADVPSMQKVWMSHGDKVQALPSGFRAIGRTENTALAAVANDDRRIYGLQFHPEVAHSPHGFQILSNFCLTICGCSGSWTMDSFIERTVRDIRQQVGDKEVILGLSGGVDSSVAAVLIDRAIGDRLTCVFVNNGVLRKNEAQEVLDLYGSNFDMNLHYVDASDRFLDKLAGVEDPETKRKIIGHEFIEVFDEAAKAHDNVAFLAQGTTYPDVIESVPINDNPSAMIKSHHNVGGLPDTMKLQLCEPIRNLFKDEVREVGRQLGMSKEVVMRQPFPGPGLAVRIVGEVTRERVAVVQNADKIVVDEMKAADLYYKTWQAFAVLLPVRSVGVMGDERTYENTIALRIVDSQDGMTADWVKMPYELLGRISNRIINEVRGVNRVVYDISSKPPATIEWE